MRRTVLIAGSGLIAVAAVLGALAQDTITAESTAWVGDGDFLGREDAAVEKHRAVSEQAAALRAARASVQPLAGRGRWESHQQAMTAKAFDVQLERTLRDGTLRGQIAVRESAAVGGGRIEGRIEGTTVSGLIVDESGAEVAAFAGEVAGTVMSGSYQTRDGDAGTWTYGE
jgi:hypothetical protein